MPVAFYFLIDPESPGKGMTAMVCQLNDDLATVNYWLRTPCPTGKTDDCNFTGTAGRDYGFFGTYDSQKNEFELFLNKVVTENPFPTRGSRYGTVKFPPGDIAKGDSNGKLKVGGKEIKVTFQGAGKVIQTSHTSRIFARASWGHMSALPA